MMRSVPESYPRELKEFVVDVTGYFEKSDNNPDIGGSKERMLKMMRLMRTMHSYTKELKIIAWKGWVIEREGEWREGTMRGEEYCDEVVRELIDSNNERQCFPY